MADSTAEDGETPVAENQLRIAVTSVFGDPWHPRTWSGAPYNVARHLARMGHHVEGLHPDLSRIRLAGLAALRWLGGHGLASKSEALQRMSQARIRRARIIAREVDRRSIDRVVHTGTLDLPLATTQDGAQHYLLCDHTWDLSLRHRPDRTNYDLTLLSQFEELERKAYADMRHIFTFAQYVRTNLIEHYGIAPDRVTVVGSGMGNILPFAGPKDYVGGHMLFVAKHLFVEKGGPLVLEGFRRARRKRPDLSLVIVGHEDHRAAAADQEGVVFFGHVPWSTLEALYRSAALLVQPMLNDPWGQVYLEALITRTPVLGLHRNGLPEITEHGRHGFLVGSADPESICETMLEAMSDPARLSRMGTSGQRHVVRNYSWERTARRIAEIVARG